MQFTLTFTLDSPLTLPISHHHLLQAMLYQTLRNAPNYNTFLHDYGYYYENHSFKLFTFSQLIGNYKISQSNIIFFDSVKLEVRSPLKDFCQFFAETARNQKCWQLGNQILQLSDFLAQDNQITSSQIKIHMQSPLCISRTIVDGTQKKPQYLTPLDTDFAALINANFQKKYKAATGILPSGDVSIETLKVNQKDKYVTRFKGIYITGWKGIYELSGSPEYLTFLYNTGIGARNSQGFGTFTCHR